MLTRIIVVLTILFCSWPCSKPMVPQYRDKLVNSNGSWNLYFIDFVQLPDASFVMDNDRNQYLISDFNSKDKIEKDKLLFDKDVFIVFQKLIVHMMRNYHYINESFHYDNLMLKLKEYTGYDGDTTPCHPTATKRINNDLSLVEFPVSAKYYMLFLMTGELYNHLKYYSMIDGKLIDKPLEFPDKEAYYKVVVPLWLYDEPSEKQSNEQTTPAND